MRKHEQCAAHWHRFTAIVGACALASLASSAALALDQPVVWRDPDTGCAYWMTPQGGIAPRFRSDGMPDCPASEARQGGAIPLISDQAARDAARDLARGLDALKREVERLSDRVGRR